MATSKSHKAADKPAASDEGAAGTEAQAAENESSSNGGPPTIEFLDMTISLPPKLRESVIWRFGILREEDFVGSARLVQSVIGAEQFGLVLDRLDELKMVVPDADEGSDNPPESPMAELLQKALAVYGLTPGESEASAES